MRIMIVCMSRPYASPSLLTGWAHSPLTVIFVSITWTPNIFSARLVITPWSSKRTLSISNLSASILKRVWFSSVLVFKDHVILGVGYPDIEKLNVILSPSLITMEDGGFFVNRGGAVGQIKQIHAWKFWPKIRPTFRGRAEDWVHVNQKKNGGSKGTWPSGSY